MFHLRAAAPADREGDKGRVTLSKVYRYRADKLPETFKAEQVAGLDEDEALQLAGLAAGADKAGLFNAPDAAQRPNHVPAAAAVIVKKADPRLARLARTDVEGARSEGRAARHRRAAAGLCAALKRALYLYACCRVLEIRATHAAG
jgi:hypothetical protein